MTLWKNGDLLELLHEGRTIQSRLKSGRGTSTPDHSSHVFAKCLRERPKPHSSYWRERVEVRY